MNNKVYVMGIGEYQNNREDVYYVNCKSEVKLVDIFIKTWQKLDPDIVTGWNTRFFDIPANEIKSFGINILPVESISNIFKPDMYDLIKSLFFFTNLFNLFT